MDAPALSKSLPLAQPPARSSTDAVITDATSTDAAIKDSAIKDAATTNVVTTDTATKDATTTDAAIKDAAIKDATTTDAATSDTTSDCPPPSLQESPTTSSTNATALSNPPPLSYAAISSINSSNKPSVRVQPGSAPPPSDAQRQPGAQPLSISSIDARHKRGRDAQDHGSVQTQGDIKLSKAMSWLLRHGAKEEGIEIGEDGLVRVKDLVGGGGGRWGEATYS